MGIALPPTAATTASNDYIGLIVSLVTFSVGTVLNHSQIGGVTNGGGWSGISHGGGMPNALLLMVWPYGETVFGSFRYAE